ncbi:MaoC family dehydratase [Streptomyces sp. NBC_01020]|uniref:MaoC family dehydratase n=1 Tax=unclassified Streptomyces TaxID=2593676 RepID=UPI002E1C2110|nr:MaoC family dehydratase [Streptomyces sp. NBC_01020]
MRYFEDFRTGDVHHLGTVTVTEEEVLEFARRFDPQPFHTDTELAERSPFGGLIASGFHTAALFMRLYVDGLLADSAGAGSPGIDKIRYHRPVRPGDVLTARLEVLASRPSLMSPATGIVEPRCELVASDGTVVFSMVLHSIFRRRPAAPRTASSAAPASLPAAQDPVACVKAG